MRLIGESNPGYESCANCIHSDDSEEICVLRRCIHAVSRLKECYVPKSPTIEPEQKTGKYHDPFGNPIYVYVRVDDKTVAIKADDLQKALDYVTEHGEEVTIKGRREAMVEELLSAQPTPCEFCKHNDIADDMACLMCSAERRTDERIETVSILR